MSIYFDIRYTFPVIMILLLSSCQNQDPDEYRYQTDSRTSVENSQTAGSTVQQYQPETFFVHSDHSTIRQGPSPSTKIIDTLDAFERIEGRLAPGTEFVQISQPISGFIHRDKIYDNSEMYAYAREEIDWYTELDMVSKNLTPLQDIRNFPETRSSYGLHREWQDDGTHKIQYVRASFIDVYSDNSIKSEKIGQLKKNNRVIIDKKYRPRSEWAKAVYPFDGYVNKNSLFNNENIVARLGRQALLVNKINRALGLPLLEGVIEPPELKKAQASAQTTQPQAKPVQTQTYRPKTIRTNLLPKQTGAPTKIIPYDAPRVSQPIVEPKQQITQQAVEIKVPEDDPPIIKQESIEKAIEETQPITNLETAAEDIPPINIDAERGYPIDIVNQRIYPDTSLTTRWADFVDLDKKLYAGIDSIVMMTYPENKLQVTALGAMSPYYLPVEKNFTRMGIPYGGTVELSKENWPASIGVGFNSMRAKSTSMVYILESKDLYLYGKYTPLKLLNDKLEMFVNAGVTGWDVGIMNDKYPEHQDYFSPESARGVSYMGGAGAMYAFKKFLFGLQYQYYGTPLVVLGPDLNEPDTQEDLSGFIPTTQYKLYAGSNQFQIIVGYRIN